MGGTYIYRMQSVALITIDQHCMVKQAQLTEIIVSQILLQYHFFACLADISQLDTNTIFHTPSNGLMIIKKIETCFTRTIHTNSVHM